MNDNEPSPAEWAAVRQAEADVVNLAYFDKYEASARAADELVALVDTLRETYGPHPALLAIRAHHTQSSVERERLYCTTYHAARAVGDTYHAAVAAHALAQHYTEIGFEAEEAERWLLAAEQLQDTLGSDDLLEELFRLRALLRRRRLGPVSPRKRAGHRTNP